MKKDKILLYSPKQETIEYKITKQKKEVGTLYSLYYSKDTQWTNSGSRVGTIEDTEDGIKVDIEDLSFEIDYSTAADLYYLLNTINKLDKNLFMNLKMLKKWQEE